MHLIAYLKGPGPDGAAHRRLGVIPKSNARRPSWSPAGTSYIARLLEVGESFDGCLLSPISVRPSTTSTEGSYDAYLRARRADLASSIPPVVLPVMGGGWTRPSWPLGATLSTSFFTRPNHLATLGSHRSTSMMQGAAVAWKRRELSATDLEAKNAGLERALPPGASLRLRTAPDEVLEACFAPLERLGMRTPSCSTRRRGVLGRPVEGPLRENYQGPPGSRRRRGRSPSRRSPAGPSLSSCRAGSSDRGRGEFAARWAEVDLHHPARQGGDGRVSTPTSKNAHCRRRGRKARGMRHLLAQRPPWCWGEDRIDRAREGGARLSRQALIDPELKSGRRTSSNLGAEHHQTEGRRHARGPCRGKPGPCKGSGRSP